MVWWSSGLVVLCPVVPWSSGAVVWWSGGPVVRWCGGPAMYRHPLVVKKYNGPAMSDYILNTTDIHSVRKYTMVQPCLFTSVTSPTSTFSAKIQWSGHGRLHPYHNRHSPRPQKYDGPALSRNMPQTTDIIHVVHKNRGFGHVRMQPSRLRHPPSPQKYNCLAMSGYNLNTTDIQLKYSGPAMSLSAKIQCSVHVHLPP